MPILGKVAAVTLAAAGAVNTALLAAAVAVFFIALATGAESLPSSKKSVVPTIPAIIPRSLLVNLTILDSLCT